MSLIAYTINRFLETWARHEKHLKRFITSGSITAFMFQLICKNLQRDTIKNWQVLSSNQWCGFLWRPLFLEVLATQYWHWYLEVKEYMVLVLGLGTLCAWLLEMCFNLQQYFILLPHINQNQFAHFGRKISYPTTLHSWQWGDFHICNYSAPDQISMVSVIII